MIANTVGSEKCSRAGAVEMMTIQKNVSNETGYKGGLAEDGMIAASQRRMDLGSWTNSGFSSIVTCESSALSIKTGKI